MGKTLRGDLSSTTCIIVSDDKHHQSTPFLLLRQTYSVRPLSVFFCLCFLQASLSMDEAARQTSSHSLSSASSYASSATMRRPGSSQRQHRRTGSVGTVSEHEVRAQLVLLIALWLHHNISVTKATKEKRKKERERSKTAAGGWSQLSKLVIGLFRCESDCCRNSNPVYSVSVSWL